MTTTRWKKPTRPAFACLILPLLSLAGCGGSSHVALNGSSGTTNQVGAFRSVGAVAADPGSYKVGTGDTLKISVFLVKDFTRQVTVSEAGNILLPLVGQVSVAGQTPQQIAATVQLRLRRYLQAPQVSVEVAAYNSQRFTVDGSVNKPGVYPIKGQTTLMQAIASAGGLGPVADETSVVVFRQRMGQKYAAIFDLRKIRSGQAPDPSMAKDDVIYVEESGTKRFAENLKTYLLPAATFVRIFTPI